MDTESVKMGAQALLRSRLAPHLSEADATSLSRYLFRRSYAPGEVLMTMGEKSNHLHVIDSGDVNIEIDGRPGPWLGVGDIIGEVGFILGTPRTATVRAGANGCTTYAIQRFLLSYDQVAQTQRALVALLAALDAPIRTRLKKLSGTAATGIDAADACDHANPQIQEAASLLVKDDAWATAHSIWNFVHRIPFRFGPPQALASETLRLGHGTSRTKANLQAALLRAAGLEAGLVEETVASAIFADLMPGGYVQRLPAHVPHVYACARIDGAWVASDATFPAEVLRVIAERAPNVASFMEQVPGQANTCRLPAFLAGAAPAPEPAASLPPPRDEIAAYDPDNADAMSAMLDKLQGITAEHSAWVARSTGLLGDAPGMAFQVALTGIKHDATRLHALMKQGK